MRDEGRGGRYSLSVMTSVAISVWLGAGYDTAILHDVTHASTRSLKQLKPCPSN